ncbi:MAG: ATP synthase F0 subunit B [Candidatus Melainabacteria bacterium]|nr:ATP synthase F0 subunit B [Candidatus Melainabacteria bacterium]
MFEINATLIIFVISFLVFMALLQKVMLEPVGRVLARRAEKIKADLDSGKAAREKAEAVLNEYHQHLQRIRSEAQAVINEAIEKANYHRNLELVRLKEQGQKNLEEARATIAAERALVMESLFEQETDLVKAISQKLVNEPVMVSLSRDMVASAMEEVG